MISIVGKILKFLLVALVLVALTAWGCAAVYFGDSKTTMIQVFVALVFGLSGLVTLIGYISDHWRYRLVLGHFILFVGVLIWWLSIQPSNDRKWQPDVAKLSYATFDGNNVTVHNIRNFKYLSEFDYRQSYYDKTYDLTKLDGVDLFAVYWMGPAIAHTIISFNFGGEDHLAVSIEARKELKEGYSSIKGFFRQFELVYVVADERDIIGLRTHFRNDPPEDVYLYRLLAPKEKLKPFFLDYMNTINELREKPVFYNTLLANCTNVIWGHSLVNSSHLPFSWKILVSGYLPEYLYESNRLDQSVTFSELRQRAYINPLAKEIGLTPHFPHHIRPESNFSK